MKARKPFASIRSKHRYLFLLLFAILLAACAPEQPVDPPPANDIEVEFTLRTGRENSDLMFVGVGGDIDGEINPTLVVPAGERFRLNLINDTGLQHNIAIRELDIATPFISGPGEEIWLNVEATTPQTLTYYCQVAGHAEAGMEGQIIVE